MYPEFLEDAKEESKKAAEQTFNYANQVEKIHHELYSRALKAVESGEDLPEKSMYVCEVCGYTVEDGAPDKCPICHTTHERFVKIE